MKDAVLSLVQVLQGIIIIIIWIKRSNPYSQREIVANSFNNRVLFWTIISAQLFVMIMHAFLQE